MVEVIVKTTHSKERARDFFKFHLFKISPMRYAFYFIALTFLIVSVVFFLIMKIETSLFFLFLSTMTLIIKVATTNSMINKATNNFIFPTTNYQLTINENQIVYVFGENDKVFKWSDILMVCEIDNYIYFYISKNSALILPKFTIGEEQRKLIADIINKSNVNYKLIKYR